MKWNKIPVELDNNSALWEIPASALTPRILSTGQQNTPGRWWIHWKLNN